MPLNPALLPRQPMVCKTARSSRGRNAADPTDALLSERFAVLECYSEHMLQIMRFGEDHNSKRITKHNKATEDNLSGSCDE